MNEFLQRLLTKQSERAVNDLERLRKEPLLRNACRFISFKIHQNILRIGASVFNSVENGDKTKLGKAFEIVPLARVADGLLSPGGFVSFYIMQALIRPLRGGSAQVGREPFTKWLDRIWNEFANEAITSDAWMSFRPLTLEGLRAESVSWAQSKLAEYATRMRTSGYTLVRSISDADSIADYLQARLLSEVHGVEDGIPDLDASVTGKSLTNLILIVRYRMLCAALGRGGASMDETETNKVRAILSCVCTNDRLEMTLAIISEVYEHGLATMKAVLSECEDTASRMRAWNRIGPDMIQSLSTRFAEARLNPDQ